MGALGIICIAVLAVCLIGIIVWIYIKINSNVKQSWTTRVFPFSQSMGVAANTEASFVGHDGQPQLKCPSGFHINIINAFAQVADPYGECTTNPTDPVRIQCGFSNNSKCNIDSDCGTDTSINCVGGMCIANQPCNNNGDCSKYGVQYGCSSEGICVDNNVCAFVNANGATPPIPKVGGNNTCTPQSNNMCAVRDISAFVADTVNGQESWNGTLSGFGNVPVPCSGIGPTPTKIVPPPSDSMFDYSSLRTNTYSQLPFTYGQAGLPSWGYYIHGTYSCVEN